MNKKNRMEKKSNDEMRLPGKVLLTDRAHTDLHFFVSDDNVRRVEILESL